MHKVYGKRFATDSQPFSIDVMTSPDYTFPIYLLVDMEFLFSCST